MRRMLPVTLRMVGPAMTAVGQSRLYSNDRTHLRRTAAEPGESRRMTIEHGDEAAMGRQVDKQPFDMRARVDKDPLPRATAATLASLP